MNTENYMKLGARWGIKKKKPTQENSFHLTRSLREPGRPCTKSLEVSESRMERVNREQTVSAVFICTVKGVSRYECVYYCPSNQEFAGIKQSSCQQQKMQYKTPQESNSPRPECITHGYKYHIITGCLSTILLSLN